MRWRIALATLLVIMHTIKLKLASSGDWVTTVISAMDAFLPDHAAAEKKASSMAMTMVSHYPDKPELVSSMIDLALEELSHFRAVVKIMHERGLSLLPDEKDPYVNAMREQPRVGKDLYLLDRLLIAGIIEARGAERFGLIAEALPEGDLKRFYQSITRSEQAHQGLFLQLARQYFADDAVYQRLDTLLDAEAAIVRKLAIRPALH